MPEAGLLSATPRHGLSNNVVAAEEDERQRTESRFQRDQV